MRRKKNGRTEMNDSLLEQINGGSDQEIRKLKNAILSNPHLRAIWEENTREHNYSSDRDIVNDILSEHINMDGFELNANAAPNTYIDFDGDGIGRNRYFSHAEILRKLREFKG